MDPAQAARELEAAADREQLFTVLLRAARSRLPFAALLSVHRDGFRGRRAIASDRFDAGAIRALQVARDVVPAFEAAVATRSYHIGPIATGVPAVDAELRRLGGVVPPAALVLPLVVGTRTVALVVGHHGEEGLAAAEVSDLFPLVAATGRVLQRMLAQRADAAAEKPIPGAPVISTPPSPDEDIDDVEAQRRVVAVCREYESWGELADAIRGLVRMGLDGGDPDEDEQLELLLELGSVEADRLGRPELAVEAWRGAQTIDAGDARVSEKLEQLFVARERWEDLLHLLEQRAALAEDPAARVAILQDVAALARDRLLDDERAIETYERIRSWAPADAATADKLEALYRAHARWQPLVALLLDVAARTEEASARVAALESAAQVYEEQLADPRAAFLVWLTVLRREPQRPGGLAALEHLGAAAAAWQELVPECEALAGELEPVDADAAARLWRQVGRWKRDHLGLPHEAADALARALGHTPEDIDLVDELLALRRAVGPWAELAALLSARAASEIDPLRRGALLTELGHVRETRLAQPEEAVAAYEDALAADPTARDAFAGLERIHQARAAWAPLAAVLARRLEVADAGDKLALHLALGAILGERLGRTEEATRAFSDALAIDPGHVGALQALARLHQAAGRTEAYLATREAELDAAAPEDARAWGELAAAWEQAGDVERAAACWQKVLARDGRDEAAHQGLVRALRRAGRWPELAQARRARLGVVASAPERVRILVELAADLEAQQDDVAGAVAACQEALALEADAGAAIDLLARCYARQGRWLEAIALLQRLLTRAPDARAKAQLQQRIARIHASRDDVPNALAFFAMALELDAANAAAHEGVARLHQQKGDWAPAADHLRQAGLAHGDRLEAIRHLTEAAALYRQRLGDLGKAAECLRRIVELDPEHADAKQDLTELLAGARDWEALWPFASERAATIGNDPSASAAERREACLQAARCALELGKGDRALELLDRAVAVDPSHVPTLLERADALRRTEAWEAAVKAYQAILVQHTERLAPAERAAAFRSLARVHQRLGRQPQALAYYRKVLDVDPRDRETLAQLAELHLERAQFDEAVGALRALAEVAAPEEQPRILERIGDLLQDELKNHGRAAATYLEVLARDGSNRRVLQKLLDLQSETGQWKAALETISRFVELEGEPRLRGKYLLARAAIRRFKLKDEAASLEDYERALDDFLHGAEPLDAATRASALDTFGNIDELFTAQKDWPRQDRAYRRLILRLGTGDPLLVDLWHSLGEIQRTRLQQYENAIIAFETAHSLDPDKSPERVRILAELYARVGKQAPARVSDHAARLVDAEPDNPEAYRAMGRACLEAGRLDEAWCVSRALVHRNQATPEEEEFYRRYQAHERRKARGVLDDDTWAQLRADGEDPVVSAIFALVWQGPVALRAGPPKSFQLKSKEKIKVEDGSRAIGKIFQNAARVLNAPLPHVYVQPERSGRLLVANCVEDGALAPAVIVGRDLMTGYRDTEIAFCVASTLALLRPAWYLRLALPAVAELEAALAAAVRLVGGPVAARAELAPLVDAFAAEMRKRLTPESAALLQGLVGRLGERPSLGRWRDAVDAAARRAGLLVCGELEAAARMVSTEPVLPDGPRAKDKVRDLVVFSVSPGYFAARRRLGVTVA